jgi:hypothetical protein
MSRRQEFITLALDKFQGAALGGRKRISAVGDLDMSIQVEPQSGPP